MRILVTAAAVMIFATPALANPDAIVVRGGDLRIRDNGSGLVFPDGSIQYRATVAGPTGPQGPAGPANTLAIGTVTTGPSGTQASATITGTAPNQTLNLTIPQGPAGTSPQLSLPAFCSLISDQNAPSPQFCRAITSFSFSTPAVTGTISHTGRTVAVTVPSGSNVSALAPTIVHTGLSIDPPSGATRNFNSPVVYTVTASDSSTETYTVTVTVAPWAVCGDILAHDGENYPTVQIGAQCWLGKNLNVGNMISTSSSPDTSCSSIQKFCYDNNENNCSTYGGLYSWTQAMCGSQAEKAQGICPSGWHIPSDPEFVTLANGLGPGGCIPYPGGNYPSTFCGAPAGDTLKTAGLCEGRTPCGTSGFNGLMGGAFSNSSGTIAFSYIGSQGSFWTSSLNGNKVEAWRRGLATAYGGVDGSYFWTSITTGRSVRCVKD